MSTVMASYNQLKKKPKIYPDKMIFFHVAMYFSTNHKAGYFIQFVSSCLIYNLKES
jgi:hypothetical protein